MPNIGCLQKQSHITNPKPLFIKIRFFLQNLQRQQFSDAEILSRVKKYKFRMKRHQTIAEQDIFKNLVPHDSNNLNSNKCSYKIWKENSSVPHHQMKTKNWPKISKSLAKRLAISEGGEWQPDNCDSQFWVAIIIPVQN